MYQPNLLQGASNQVHTYPHKMSTCANFIHLNNLIIHFNHLQTLFKPHSIVQSLQMLNSQTNGGPLESWESWESMRGRGMSPSPQWPQTHAWGATSSSDPGVAECPGSNFNRHKSISLPGVDISCSSHFPGWEV